MIHFKILLALIFSLLVACDKKTEEEVKAVIDNSPQVVSTTTTTMPESVSTTTTTLPSTTTSTLPVPTTTVTTTTLPVTTTTMAPVTTTTSTTTTTTLPVASTTTTSTTTTSTTTTSTTMPPSAGFDIFKDVAYVVGGEVDKVYSSYRELLAPRGGGFVHKTDQCDLNLVNRNSFADRVAYFVNMNMTARKAQLGLIADLFAIPSNSADMVATSLISHPMCEVTADSLKKTIDEKGIPNSKVIEQMNSFVKKYNTLRSQVLSGNKAATLDMNRLWSRMSMCLTYVQSLTTADRNLSDKTAEKFAPSDYRRPAGVLFYEDPNQAMASRLNIGLFQFSPDSGGNIHTCIKQWNAIYPQCQIPAQGSSAEMIRLLGSSYQSFNSFCGTEKPVETFAVQVNTVDAKRTHPANMSSGGKLKAPADRCVSLHFSPGIAYNAFGPFANSTSNNLKELMDCALE